MEGQVKEHKVAKSPTRKRPVSGDGMLPRKKTVNRKRKLEYQNSIKKRSVAYILGTV